jgi:hypothetical protein
MATRERLGWLLLGGVLAAALARAVLVPEVGWDAYSHWGLRAQAYALAGTIVNAGSEHEYYPPLVPLLEAWLYLQRGMVSLDFAKTVWALIGAAFGVCLAWHLRLSLPLPWLAPFFATAIIASTTALLESFWTGQADLALTTFLTLAALAVFQWQRSAERAWLIQAAVFGAAATLTKFEGLPRIGVVVAALLLEGALTRRRAPLLPALVLAASAAAGWLAWTTFELTHAIPSSAEHLGALQPLALGAVLLTLAAIFGGLRAGGALLIAVLSFAVAGGRMFSPPLRLLSIVVLGQLALTLVAFLMADIAPEIEARTSATRLFEQLLPLALFAGAVGLTATYNRPGR